MAKKVAIETILPAMEKLLHTEDTKIVDPMVEFCSIKIQTLLLQMLDQLVSDHVKSVLNAGKTIDNLSAQKEMIREAANIAIERVCE